MNLLKLNLLSDKYSNRKNRLRDDMIYEFIKGNQKDILNLKSMDREECIKTMKPKSNTKKVLLLD